jgi:hypothetical protein
MRFFRGAIVSLFLAVPANAQNYVSVESGGRSYVVDVDSQAVQKNLKPANPQAGAIKFPTWLTPYPGATPKRANYDVRTGISSAYFDSGGTVDEAIGYYLQLFRSNGFTAGQPMGGASKIVSGKNASGTVSAIASVVRGVVEIQVTFAPSAANLGKKHFKAAWYDDARGLLCLEDTSTGEQYYLDKSGILEANVNRPGGVRSEGAAMPSWLPVYPAATRAKVQMGFNPTITFVARAPIRTVYNWYKEAVRNAGAQIVDSGIMRSGTPLEDFSAQIVAVLGDDKVDIRIGKTFALGLPQLPKDEIGIGIRYSVPKR